MLGVRISSISVMIHFIGMTILLDIQVSSGFSKAIGTIRF